MRVGCDEVASVILLCYRIDRHIVPISVLVMHVSMTVRKSAALDILTT